MIDAHHHFWHPARGDYGWMPPGDPILTRPYAPVDLAAGLAATGVTHTVLVQAAPTVEETEYLLGIADSTPHVAGVVGWIDFEDRQQARVLERLARHPKFLGVRPMIQDLPDDDWMLRDEIGWAFDAIQDLDLTFDCLGFPRHMENFLTLLTRYPDLRSVLDHCLKPQLRAHSPENFDHWAERMTRLAGETNAFVKLSGLVTEADAMPDAARMQPYVDHIVDRFGPRRMMWGSDWPVCRLRCEYEVWHDLARTLTKACASVDRDRIFGGTARQFYRLVS